MGSGSFGERSGASCAMTYTPRKAQPPPPIVGKPRQKCKEPECVHLAEHRRFYCFMHQTPKLRGT